MRLILKIASTAGLCLTVIPSFLVWYGVLEWSVHAVMMFAGMILWFVTAPLWVNR